MTEKEQFSTGAMRDQQIGKTRYDLIPIWVDKRLADLLESGAIKYAEYNWAKGMPVKRTYASLRRHLRQLLERDRSEDHFAAVLFNAMVLEHTLVGIEDGSLPPELYDLDHDFLSNLEDFPTDYAGKGVK